MGTESCRFSQESTHAGFPLYLTISPVGLPTQIITLVQLQQQFDKPLAKVAHELNMCTTVFKVHPIQAHLRPLLTFNDAESVPPVRNKTLAVPQSENLPVVATVLTMVVPSFIVSKGNWQC